MDSLLLAISIVGGIIGIGCQLVNMVQNSLAIRAELAKIFDISPPRPIPGLSLPPPKPALADQILEAVEEILEIERERDRAIAERDQAIAERDVLMQALTELQPSPPRTDPPAD